MVVYFKPHKTAYFIILSIAKTFMYFSFTIKTTQRVFVPSSLESNSSILSISDEASIPTIIPNRVYINALNKINCKL